MRLYSCYGHVIEFRNMLVIFYKLLPFSSLHCKIELLECENSIVESSKLIRLKDDWMDYVNNLLANELELGKISGEMQKIIVDIIFQHVQDMVFVMKVEQGPLFRYLFVNKSGMKKANLSVETIGKTLQESLPDDVAHALQYHFQKLLKKQELISFDDQFYLDDGKMIYTETILIPIYNKKSAINYVVAVTREITKRTLKKNKILENEQMSRSIIENNLDGIITINPEGRIIEANPAAAIMTGHAEKYLNNRSIYDLINDHDIDELKSHIEKTCSGYALESFDCRILHFSGRVLMVHLKIVPIAVQGIIRSLFVIVKDLSEQAGNMEMIKFLALHDQLTGLLNRRALLEHLNQHIYYLSNKNQEFALISIDLDRFKYLNDTLGHLAGDEILKTVAGRLSRIKNDNCYIYRLGGDEFAILLLQATRLEASNFVKRVFSIFSHSYYFNSQEYFITPSIGISMYPNDGKDAEMLIKNADSALYRVKERGKAHFQFYRRGVKSSISNIITLETHLRKAIERNELSVYYQPQIEVATGKTKSLEALLRWNNNEFGPIPPSVFIPLAEDTGLIIPIGNWVIEKACQQINQWNKRGYDNLLIAINISPKQFQHPNLVPFIKSMLEKYQIKASSLEIEITEGAMSDTEETIPILRKVRKLGITISVDDFGTGYSSLNYLKQYPIDVLKIDQSFIKDILVNQKDAAITTTIIHLGKSLGLEVVAEGVETKKQVDFLAEAGCHKIQGYFYARPLPVDEVEQQFILDSKR